MSDMKVSHLAAPLLAVLLSFSGVCRAQYVFGPVLGRSVGIQVPAGYCALKRDSPLGKAWYRQTQETNAELAVIGMIFLDCQDLREKERDMDFIAARYGVATVVAPGGQVTLVNHSRADYIREVAAIEPPSPEEYAKSVTDAFARLSTPSATRGAGILLGLMDVDENAAYFGQASISFYPSGPVRMDTLTVWTTVEQLPIAVHLHMRDEGDETFQQLLAQGKRLAADMLKVNTQ